MSPYSTNIFSVKAHDTYKSNAVLLCYLTYI